MQQIGGLMNMARTAPMAARAAQQGNVGGYLSLANNANQLANMAGFGNRNVNTGLGAANNLYGLYGGIQRGGVGGTLQAANSANALANRAGFGNTAVNQGLGGVNSAYQIYNAIKNPTAENVVSGLAGANKLGGMATGNSAGLLGGAAGSALGAANAGLGIYNAIKNPNPINIASGLYDAYKLYGLANSAGLLGGGAAGAGAGAAGAGAAGEAAGTTATTLGSYAGPIGMGIAALAAIAANNTKAHSNAITQLGKQGSITNIPGSSQSAALYGNVGLGAGNDRSQGSGQFYVKNPTTGQLTWAGRNGSDLMTLIGKTMQTPGAPLDANLAGRIADAVTDPNYQTKYASTLAKYNVENPDWGGPINPSDPAFGGGETSFRYTDIDPITGAVTALQSPTNNLIPRFQQYWNELGGEKGTGSSFRDFLANTLGAGSSVTGNVWGH
jgi:hypothetical protein